MFASGFNQGLKAARNAPSTPLVDLRALEVDSDDKEVCYGEDDNPLPQNTPHLPFGPQGENTIDNSVNDLVRFAPASPATSVTHSNN